MLITEPIAYVTKQCHVKRVENSFHRTTVVSCIYFTIKNHITLPGETNRTYKVNYVAAMMYCSDCEDDFCPSCNQVHYFSGLDVRDHVYYLCTWATSNPANHGSGDGHFCYCRHVYFHCYCIISKVMTEIRNTKLFNLRT